MKWIFILFLFLSIGNTEAHQPDLSQTMLIEQEDSTYILQVRAAMTAFKYEVETQFPDRTYSSPEEFKELVIEHMMKSLAIRFNGLDSVELLNPYVKLGHETNVLFEIKDVPETVSSLFIKNNTFSDIRKNQSALVVLKEGFSKERFVLNESNSHRADLVVKGNKFALQSEEVAIGSLHSSRTSMIVIMLISFGMMIFFWVRSKAKLA